MSSEVLQRATETFKCSPPVKEKVRLLSPEPYTHASLKVCDTSDSAAPDTVPDTVQVSVFDGSSGTRVTIRLNTSDTIFKLKQKYLKHRPKLLGILDLAYNGKPANEKSTLAELGVKSGATMITFQRCTGG